MKKNKDYKLPNWRYWVLMFRKGCRYIDSKTGCSNNHDMIYGSKCNWGARIRCFTAFLWVMYGERERKNVAKYLRKYGGARG